MTSKQEAYYWRLWAQACVEQGWNVLPSQERNEKRHAVHAAALKRDKSHKAFTNAECDKVFSALKVLADPTNIKKLVTQDTIVNGDHGERQRLYRTIEMMMPRAYRESIMRDKFDTVHLDDLDLRQLEQLRITLIERKRAQAKRERIAEITSTPALIAQPLDFPSGHPVIEYQLKPFPPTPTRATADNHPY